jgi:hypothetical protein
MDDKFTSDVSEEEKDGVESEHPATFLSAPNALTL